MLTDGENKKEKKEQLTYEEIQDFFERTLKLITPPVAVKFVMRGEEKPSGLAKNIKPITFCQGVTVARQGGYSIYLERETLACYNARICFGLGTEEEVSKDIENSIEKTVGKYAPTRKMATKIVMNKFRIPAGKVKGVGIAQLGKARFIPNALIFTCFPWQSNYLTNAYLWMTGDVPIYFETAPNSLVCGYSAGIAGWKKKINCCTACTGGRAYAGTESTEVYWSLPWEYVDTVIEGLKGRSMRNPYPSLINIPIPVPAPENHFFRTKSLTEKSFSKPDDKPRKT
jgi:uncharacterized protein (DUF169 family)